MGEIKKMSTVEELKQVDSLTVDSRELAKLMELEHKNLIRKIDTHIVHLIEEDNEKYLNYFVEQNYLDSAKRNMVKRYDVTKKGCDLLAHKMQGKKGTLFSVAYIDAFYNMERELKIREIDDFKALAEQSIKGMRHQINTETAEKESLKKENERLKAIIGLRDKEIAINNKDFKQLEAPKNNKPKKEKVKKEKKRKQTFKEKFESIDYKLPPHDNYMSSDKHLNDEVFSLTLSSISERNNLKLSAKDLNIILEFVKLETLISKGKRDVGPCIEGMGYARIVSCGFDKTNKPLRDLRWSMAGEKYLIKFIRANAFQLDNVK